MNDASPTTRSLSYVVGSMQSSPIGEDVATNEDEGGVYQYEDSFSDFPSDADSASLLPDHHSRDATRNSNYPPPNTRNQSRSVGDEFTVGSRARSLSHSQPHPSPRHKSNLLRIMLGWNFWVDGWLRWVFIKWSIVVVYLPLLLAAAMMLIFVGLGMGVLLQDDFERDEAYLWLSDNSVYTQDNDYWNDLYGESEMRFLVTARDAKKYGANLVNNTMINVTTSDRGWVMTSYLHEAYRLQEALQNVTVNVPIGQPPNVDVPFAFEQVCVHTNSSICLLWSVLDYWHFNREAMANDSNPLKTISGPHKTSRFHQPLLRESVCGGVEHSINATQNITEVKALRTIFYVSKIAPDNIGQDVWNTLISDWSSKLTSQLNGWYSPLLDVDIFIKSSSAELLYEGNNDKQYMYISLGIMFIFLVFALVSGDCINSKVLLAFSGMLHVALACFASTGVCGYLQIISTPLSPTLYFMIATVGINHILLLVHAFERTLSKELEDTKEDEHDEEQYDSSDLVRNGPKLVVADEKKWVSGAMAEVLPPITVECVSAMLAFLAISISGDPGFRAFGQQAAIAMLCEYVLLISFFCACLVLDSRRIATYRSDILPCISCVPDIDGEDDSASTHHSTNAVRRIYLTQGGRTQPFSLIRPFVSKYYAPNMLRIPGLIICVICCLALFGIGLWGLSTGVQSFDREDLFTAGSEEHNYLVAEKEWFVEGTTPFSLITKEVPYEQNATGHALIQLMASINSSDYVHTDSFYPWYQVFLNYLATNPEFNNTLDPFPYPPEDQFYPYLAAFLKDPRGSLFCNDLRFIVDLQNEISSGCAISNVSVGVTLVSSRVRAWNEGLANLTAQIDGIKSLYSVTTKSVIDAFPYGPNYPFYMTFPEMVSSWKMYLTLSSVIVFAVMFLMLDVISAISVMIVYGLVYVALMGIVMNFSNPSIPISQLSLAAVIVTTAITVSYSIHIVHEFAIRKGTRKERMHDTLSTVGCSVAAAFGCVVLGALVSLAVESTLYWTFVVMFISSVVLSFGHSFIFIPALLVTFGVDNPK